MERPRTRDVLLFGVRFVLFAATCLVLWSFVMPYYAWVLGQVCGLALKFVGGVRVDHVDIVSKGILGTDTSLTYAVRAAAYEIDISALVNNIPAFLGLILATVGIPIRRRLNILRIGLTILVAGHMLFLILFYGLRDSVEGSAQVLESLGKIFLTLPFLLWIVLAYRDRLAAFFGSGTEPKNPQAS